MSTQHVNFTVVTHTEAETPEKARADIARLLMAVAIGVLEGDDGDALPGGVWALAVYPAGEEE
jgi:hypothetical protein